MKDKDIIICRCEEITKGEIIQAIRDGATTVDGIKRMTRAGKGLCQGRTCRPLVEAILMTELGHLPPAEEYPSTRPPVRPMAAFGPFGRGGGHMKQHSEFVIIGGGVLGASLAYQLSLHGREVLLLEQNEICSGTSSGTVAWIGPFDRAAAFYGGAGDPLLPAAVPAGA